MPLLVLPGFSSKEGMSVPEAFPMINQRIVDVFKVIEAFWDGWTCYTQQVLMAFKASLSLVQDPDCARGGAFLLLTGRRLCRWAMATIPAFRNFLKMAMTSGVSTCVNPQPASE